MLSVEHVSASKRNQHIHEQSGVESEVESSLLELRVTRGVGKFCL